MQLVRKSSFAKFVIGIIAIAFFLNNSGIAFAASNLKRSAAREEIAGVFNLGNDLIRTQNRKDGGTAMDKYLFDLAFEEVAIREDVSVGASPRVQTWMEKNSPTRVSVTAAIVGHLQRLKDDIKDKAKQDVSAELVVNDFAQKVNKRLKAIHETANKEKLSKEVTLVVGSWLADEENPAIETQIEQAKKLLELELDGISAEMFKTLRINVAFEFSKKTKEEISKDPDKEIKAVKEAHEAIYNWFVKKYPGRIKDLWGSNLRMYAVTSNPFGPLNIRTADGTFLTHGILFASGGLDVKKLIKILKDAAQSGLVNGRMVEVLMDFKSFPLEKRNPSSINIFAKQLYDAARSGKINSNFFRLTIADTEGNLRDWSQARLQGELSRFVLQAGEKLTVAIVGGAPKAGAKKQGIGSGWFRRGLAYFNMRGGSRSENDPKNDIYLNKDSVKGAQIVQIATPATAAEPVKGPDGKPVIDDATNKPKMELIPLAAWKKTIREIAPNLEEGAIIIVMGNALDPKDQDALKAEGFTSLGELTQSLIHEVVPGKGVKVVESFNNAPGEWVTFETYQMKMDVIAVGDDQIACQFAIDNYINKFYGLNGVYGGPLANGQYLEYLTKLIIKSKKKLLLGEPLKKLFDYLVENKDKVSYEKEKLAVMVKDITAFNQPAFEAEINKILTDPQSVLLYLESIKGIQRYSVIPEINSILLRGYAERIKDIDSKTCALITKTCDECDKAIDEDLKGVKAAKDALKADGGILTDKGIGIIRSKIESSDTGMNSALPGNFNRIIEVLKKYANKYGALVFKADTILNNSGSVAFLRTIKESGLPVRVIVWTDDRSEAETLKLMGVGEVATIQQAALENVFGQLEDDQGEHISAKQTVAIGFEKENELPAAAEGVTVFKLDLPQLALEGDSFINAMPLVIIKALAIIFKNEEGTKAYAEVTNVYEEVTTNYFKADKIDEYQLTEFNDLKTGFFEVPLAKVTEEVANSQIVYEAAVALVKDL
jgi:predicted dinucleotide-binding enzyme